MYIPNDEQYDQLQEALIAGIGQPMWDTTRHLIADRATLNESSIVYHVQQPFQALQADLSDYEASHMSRVALHSHQVLDYHLDILGQPIFNVFDTMCNTRQLLSHPIKPTDTLTAQYSTALHVIAQWLYQGQMLPTFLSHMLIVEHDTLRGRTLTPRNRSDQLAHQLWLNMVAVSAFHTTIQHTPYRPNLPWMWQEPLVLQRLFDELHEVDSRFFFNLAHTVMRSPKD